MNAIDIAVCKRVFKNEFVTPTHGRCCACQTCGHQYDSCKCQEYSSDEWAAGEVISFMESQGFTCGIDVWEGSAQLAAGRLISFRKDGFTYCDIDKSLSVAICLAALRATGLKSVDIDLLRSSV